MDFKTKASKAIPFWKTVLMMYGSGTSEDQKRFRTTNSLERLNEEIHCRERVIRIFPNRASAVRLLGAFLMEISEKWASGRKYLGMTEYLQWRKVSKKPHSKVIRIG
jgi:transposase-like protein